MKERERERERAHHGMGNIQINEGDATNIFRQSCWVVMHLLKYILTTARLVVISCFFFASHGFFSSCGCVCASSGGRDLYWPCPILRVRKCAPLVSFQYEPLTTSYAGRQRRRRKQQQQQNHIPLYGVLDNTISSSPSKNKRENMPLFVCFLFC
jgi:hypothetical protein